MKLTEDIIRNIIEADIRTLWEHYNLFDTPDEFETDAEYEEYKQEQNKIRYGFRMRFSIDDVWDMNRIMIKGNDVIINDPDTYQKRKYKIEDYRTEKLQRVSQMRRFIYKNSEIVSTLVPD